MAARCGMASPLKATARSITSAAGGEFSALPLHAVNHGQRKVQALVGNERRRRRHWIGTPQHRERRLIEGRIARALTDRCRNYVADAIEREADFDPGATRHACGWIALEALEMR